MWRGPVLSGLLWTALAGSAHADAFLERPGEGKIILLGTFDAADRYWTRDGRLLPVAQYRKFSLSALTEYGLDSTTTLFARAEGGYLHDAAGSQGQGSGRSARGACCSRRARCASPRRRR